MAVKLDPEIEEYRTLLDVPDHYEDGFGAKSMLGALFVAFVMVPASMYLQLLSGAGLGGVEQWVTVILFAEVAKRSFTTLRRQEIYVLFYVVGSVMSQAGVGSGFSGMIFNQYLVRSPMAENFGIADRIPRWVVPPADSPAIAARTFLSGDWLVPILLMVLFTVLNRLFMMGLGYTLFRITSDRERLPFPMAPVSALGITALAESTEKKETWRWRLFSVGAIMGIIYGFIYLGVPALTGAMLPKPVQIIPIPFLDLTTSFESILPATPVMVTFDLFAFISGTWLPFWAVIGTVLAAFARVIFNPFILHRAGFLPSWERGMGAIETLMSNSVDFYMSFGIGMSLAVAFTGIYMAVSGIFRARRERIASGQAPQVRSAPPPGRGDYSLKLAVAMFLIAATVYVYVAHSLVPAFPLIILIIFAFVVSPVQSYIDARLIGLVGRTAPLPMVREATFILSKYQGIDIWYMPWPLINVGGHAQFFRVVELTGTKITSIVKAELFMVPLILATSFIFWSFIWKLAPIPSPTYPYAQKMWPLSAMNSCLWPTATLAKGNYAVAENRAYRLDEVGDQWAEVIPPGMDDVAIRQVGLDPRGNRWFATDRGALKDDGRIWMQFTKDAVKRYDPGQKQWIEEPEQVTGLPSDNVLSVFVQERRYIWFGTDRGIARFDGKENWAAWGPEEGLASANITVIAVDKDGRVWAGSDSGLSFFDGMRWSSFTVAEGLRSNTITALTTDTLNNAWVGTPNGLHSINVRGEIRTYTAADTQGGLPGDHILSIALERVPLAQVGREKDVLWIGTESGLCRYDPAAERWESFAREEHEHMPPDLVYSVTVEPSTRRGVGPKWFATDVGIVRYDERNNHWRLYESQRGLPQATIGFITLSAGKRYLLDALRLDVVSAGLGIGLVIYIVLSILGLPILLIYGFIGGITAADINLSITPLMLAGALAGRFFFIPKYGSKQWRQYAMVLSAGYGCGNGLIAMFGVAVALIAKSISQLPF